MAINTIAILSFVTAISNSYLIAHTRYQGRQSKSLNSDDMMSVVPELRVRKLTYDIGVDDTPPEVDDLLVSIGKGLKPNSVYLVASCRFVTPRNPNRYVDRYALEVILCPELRDKAKVVLRRDGIEVSVTVNDKYAHPVFWNSRKKK